MVRRRKTSSAGDIREIEFKDSLNFHEVSQDADFTEFEKFIMYGIDQTASTSDFLKLGMIIIFFSLPVILKAAIEGRDVFLGLFLLPTAVYLISTCRLQQGGIIEGPRYILYSGIWAECFSVLCALIGVDIFFLGFSGKERIVFILIAIVGYICAIALYGYIVRRAIRKKAYSNILKAALIPAGVSGVYVGRVVFSNLEGKAEWVVPSVLFLFISYTTSFGVLNIYRFLYIMKHPEILGK